jgi:hypothetical protein
VLAVCLEPLRRWQSLSSAYKRQINYASPNAFVSLPAPMMVRQTMDCALKLYPASLTGKLRITAPARARVCERYQDSSFENGGGIGELGWGVLDQKDPSDALCKYRDWCERRDFEASSVRTIVIS